MYDKKDKRQLYWLIDSSLSGKIDLSTFCDEFYYSYDLELDKGSLSTLEASLFEELNSTASRFSKYDSDHKLDSKAFSTEEELMKKIKYTREQLSATWLIS